MSNSRTINYNDRETVLEGYLAGMSSTGKKPAVIVAHDWSGRNNFAQSKVEKLAESGFIGFALDMYGNGKTGSSKEEKSALIQPLIKDRNALQRRVIAAYDTVKQLPGVDSSKIAAIGFCFGGLCVLDLARSGANVAGVVSFHGLLGAPDQHGTKKIISKVLALHGYNDPMVTPDDVIAFGKEMTAANADWQLHMYGNTMHAFTNPEANDPDFGTVYNASADRRSWQAMIDFFNEIF